MNYKDFSPAKSILSFPADGYYRAMLAAEKFSPARLLSAEDVEKISTLCKNNDLKKESWPRVSITSFGKAWRNEKGQLHRKDGPAVDWFDGTKEWWINDKYHRIGGPAIEWGNGTKSWWVNGKRHRDDGPAIERANGSKEWWVEGKQFRYEDFRAHSDCEVWPRMTDIDGTKFWKNKEGQLHRDDGPAAEYISGDKIWFQNGEYHRVDGPAVENASGQKGWFVNGKLHRVDGPAIENDLSKHYYIEGKQLTAVEFHSHSDVVPF